MDGHRRASSHRKMLDDETATEAVLTFLRGTKVGCMVSLAPPEKEQGGARTEKREETRELYYDDRSSCRGPSGRM